MGGDKNVGWKKAVGEEGVKTKSARRPIDPWDVNVYFDFKYEMAPNTSRPKKLIEKFQTSLITAVTVLYEEDPAVCVLHWDEPYLKQLQEMTDFYKKYSTWSKCMRFDNLNSFNRGTDDKPRTFRGTIRLRSRMNIKNLVATCPTDLTLEAGISFFCKDLQPWETVQSIALVCSNNKILADHATFMMKKLYRDSEQTFMERYPENSQEGPLAGSSLTSL